MAAPRSRHGGGSQSRCFFKFFFPNLSAERLRIPPSFSKLIAGEPGGTFSLEGPSGSKWEVELVKGRDGFFIERGWKEFVADHCVAVGDLLLFSYTTQSRFNVMVFDTTNCEKEVAFFAWPSKHPISMPASDAVAAPSGFRDSYMLRRRLVCDDGLHSNFFNSHRRNFSKPDNGDRMMQQPFKKNKGPEHQSDSTMSCLALLKCSALAQVENLLPRRSLLSQRRPVTLEEMDKAIEMSKSFNSVKPFFSVVMKEAYVYSSFFMNMPSSFVMEYLPRVKTEMYLLSPHGKTWPVIYIWHSERRGSFSGGWAKFSCAHNLEKGDVCVFEMIEENSLRVHIFRVVEELTPLIRIGKTRNTIVTP